MNKWSNFPMVTIILRLSWPYYTYSVTNYKFIIRWTVLFVIKNKIRPVVCGSLSINAATIIAVLSYSSYYYVFFSWVDVTEIFCYWLQTWHHFSPGYECLLTGQLFPVTYLLKRVSLKCPIGCLWWYKCDQILNIIIVFSDIKPVSAILPFASKLIKKLFISECLSFPRLSTWWYYLPSLIEYENNVAFALGCTFNNYFFNLQIKMKNEDG